MSAWLLEVFTLERVGVGPDVSVVVRGPNARVGRRWSRCQRGVRGPYSLVGRRWSRCQCGC